MAGRPYKIGLDYFPIDIDIAEDQSVGYVEAKYGVVAFGILIKLLIKIYRSGYYTTWTERDQYLFLKHTLNVDINLLREIVSAYINSGFFNKPIADTYQVLTSHGIQKRYITACERRTKITLCQVYACISPNHEDFPTNNVSLIPLIDDRKPLSADTTGTETQLMAERSTQSKVKQSKEQQSKEVDVVLTNPLPPSPVHPKLLGNRNGHRALFDKLLKLYPKTDDSEYAVPIFYGYMDSGELTEEILEKEVLPGLEVWKQSGDWQESDGRYIQKLEKFLDMKQWRKKPKHSQQVAVITHYTTIEEARREREEERVKLAERLKQD